MIREELMASVHGEVDDESWQAKQTLLRHQSNVKRDSAAFADYVRQSFIDTLTLYLTASAAISMSRPAPASCLAAICASA